MATSNAQRSPRNQHMSWRPASNGNSPPSRGNASRGNAYTKMIHRFYEALILLNLLGKTRDARDVNPGQAFTLEQRRRRLLRNLSYLCDYKKGGETISAIALEEKTDRFSFWVASNAKQENNRTIGFLESVLADVKAIIHSPRGQGVPSEGDLARICVQFARPRVHGEINLLAHRITDCKSHLDLETNDEDIALWAWFDRFLENRDGFEICLLAYNQRKAPEMRILKTKIIEAQKLQTPDHIPARFDLVRHFIGRLAHHIRAPKQVIEDLSHLDRFLTSYDVRSIPKGDDIVPPKADSRTTLSDILGRMFAKDDPRLRDYRETLPIIDQRLNLQQKVVEQYNPANFKPVVHAEIRVLEHFFENRLRFADNDKYIGCSKPACFCCQLYFEHHPLRCVKPDGHHNVWLNWGPPALPGGPRNPRYIHQRNILNKMIPTIRQDALEQLDNKVGPLNEHPDSHTGITPTEASGHSNMARLTSVETEFAALSIERADPSTSENEDNRSTSPAFSSLSSVRADGPSSPPSEVPSESEDEKADLDDGSDAEGGGGAALG